MNFNIYLEDSLGKKISHLANLTGKSRNSIIREALQEWVAHHVPRKWPKSVCNFKGGPHGIRFEEDRDKLLPPREDPFA